MAYLPFGGQTYSLAGSISSTDSTITLSSFLEPVTNTPYTMANTGSTIIYGTIAPKTSTSEFISFTGITQNANGTATLTGVTRGLAKKTPYTTDAAYKLPHAGQTQFIISDVPQLFDQYLTDAQIDTDPTLAANSDAVMASQKATKTYIGNVITGFTGTATNLQAGTTKISVPAASAGDPIAVGDNDGRVPTQGENDALVGNNTDIAVGTGNKLVTQTGLQHNAEKYAADAGANDTYVITLSPVPTSYTNGMVVHFKANTVNTGAATLNVNSLGAKTIVKYVNTTLADGDIAAGMFCTVIYDGTNFVLQNTPVLTTTSFANSLPLQDNATVYELVASASVKSTNSANVVFPSATTPVAYTKFKETQYNNISGIVRVIYTLGMQSGSGTSTPYSRIYVNGVAVGTEQSGTNTFSQDISLVQGDLVQIYAKINSYTSGNVIYQVGGLTLGYVKQLKLSYNTDTSIT